MHTAILWAGYSYVKQFLMIFLLFYPFIQI